MPEKSKSLGKLVAVYALAPEHVQRAVFIAVLSFVFFLGMMVVFYIRENVLYFLLASAFLVIYIVTLLSWVIQRRSVVNLYENGLTYKKRTVLWTEIEAVNTTGETGEILVSDEKPVLVPKTLYQFDSLIQTVRSRTS